jgi:hypothetical protein
MRLLRPCIVAAVAGGLLTLTANAASADPAPRNILPNAPAVPLDSNLLLGGNPGSALLGAASALPLL